MKRYWPVMLMLAMVGCSDSRTASLDREVESLQRQVARLEAENAELRERANALSLDLEHQRFVNNELRAKTGGGPAAAESAGGGSASPLGGLPKPVAEASAASVTPVEIAPKPEEKPVTLTPEVVAPPVSPPKPARPAVASKPPGLPDIKPKSAANKSAETSSAKTDEEKGYKPSSAQDPFAAFKKPEGGAVPKPATTSPKPPPAGATAEAKASTTVAAAAEKPRPAARTGGVTGLQLVGVNASHVGDSIRISGEALNNTDRPALRVRVKAVFLDDEGHVVSSSEYAIEGGDRLDAGGRARFEVTSPADPSIARWRVTPLAEQTTP